MMKITLFGATGEVGIRLVNEALARGHEVTGVARTEQRLAELPAAVRRCVADIADPDEAARCAAGQDLLISAVRPSPGREQDLVALTRSLLNSAGAKQRILVAGGAARLYLPGQNGDRVLTAPGFLPSSVIAIARACQAQYELCLGETRAAWTYLSPPAMLTPGERTGGYRLGTDTLLMDSNDVSRISVEDFAVAMLDEAESARHIRQAFTVGY